jgi:hypothetical protein
MNKESDNTNRATDNKVKKLLRIPTTVTRRLITEPKKFARLAKRNGWINPDETVWPISMDNLLRYIAFSHNNGNQPATISTYLSTLARFHSYKGYFQWKNEIRMHPVVRTALQNLRANHQFPAVRQKDPITIDMLERIKEKCDITRPHQALFWCIATVAFHTLSRIGELVVSNHRRTPFAIRMAHLDIQLEAKIPFISITLPRTKVHNPSKPEFILIRATHDSVCPLKAFLNYLKIREKPLYAPGSTGLFVLTNGALASRDWFLGGLSQALPQTNVAGQSFRAGGATHLAMRGAPRLVLQRLGRWNSATFERYIRTQPALIIALSEPYTNSAIAQPLLNRRPATPYPHALDRQVTSAAGSAENLGRRPRERNRKEKGRGDGREYRELSKTTQAATRQFRNRRGVP